MKIKKIDISSILPIIINNIKLIFDDINKLEKLIICRSNISELTVLVRAKIANLKDLSKPILSKTKKVKYKASVNILKKARRITNKPIVAIGGINSNNYQKLLLNKANFLAISGYIWKNKKIKPIEAINKFI